MVQITLADNIHLNLYIQLYQYKTENYTLFFTFSLWMLHLFYYSDSNHLIVMYNGLVSIQLLTCYKFMHNIMSIHVYYRITLHFRGT